ncbi:MAG: Histidine triad protein [uncultured bacterium]|nr:MAG: Histidine triad protein [uncultured bacterium]
MIDCPFCAIAQKNADAVVIWEDSDIVAFLDRSPIREGHCQIIPRKHIETFEEMPSDIAGKIIELGQRLARKMKTVYKVDRVAFLFTGGDVAHTHAHVVPMHEKGDITSARYIVNSRDIQFCSSHLQVNKEILIKTRTKLQLNEE